MANVLVVHPDLNSRGGAEAVCMNLLEALQDDHTVDLLTFYDFDINSVNSYFDTYVQDVRVLRPQGYISWIRKIIDASSELSDFNFGRLKHSFLGRYVNKKLCGYDLTISTKNELFIDGKSIQYIHSPKSEPKSVPGIRGNQHILVRPYTALCNRVSGASRDSIMQGKLLANSKWTSNIVSQIHDHKVEVVHPPVSANFSTEENWRDRENGFLTIGRVTKKKNVLMVISIIEELRREGHDTHLHIIGPMSNSKYVEKVRRKATELEYITLEGKISRSRLLELIGSHKYGIHGRKYEHFGISVAELVNGGAIPFIPNYGGQIEIVGNSDLLTYEEGSDAVQKIDRLLSDPELQSSIRTELEERRENFSQERFKSKITAAVDELL